MDARPWLLLVLSLPGAGGAPRMRVWRALKGLGAGILRDGVYLLPRGEATERGLRAQADAVAEAGGTAYLVECAAGDAGDDARFRAALDRTADYEAWIERAAVVRDRVDGAGEAAARREEAQLRRDLEAIVATDYFPGEPRRHAEAAMREIAAAMDARFSPDEPTAAAGRVEPVAAEDYRDRVWATRANLWVDRVASAWLVRRFVDPGARFRWRCLSNGRTASRQSAHPSRCASKSARSEVVKSPVGAKPALVRRVWDSTERRGPTDRALKPRSWKAPSPPRK